jgi:hypothetical protein
VKHVRQPDDVTCAQACAAMLLGAPLERVLAFLPARPSGTAHRKLVAFLRRCGVDVADQFAAARGRELPRFAFARITWPDREGHLVLKVERTWHDPYLPGPFSGDLPSDRMWTGGGRVTSFLEVRALPLAA